MLSYSVELKPQEEGGYTVTVPILPGCISEGDTMEEALKNIKEAVEGYIEVMVKNCNKTKKHKPLEVCVLRLFQVRVFELHQLEC